MNDMIKNLKRHGNLTVPGLGLFIYEGGVIKFCLDSSNDWQIVSEPAFEALLKTKRK